MAVAPIFVVNLEDAVVLRAVTVGWTDGSRVVTRLVLCQAHPFRGETGVRELDAVEGTASLHDAHQIDNIYIVFF